MASLSKEPAGLRGGQRAAVALALTMLMAGSLAAKQHSRVWKKGTLVDTETVTISGAPVAVAQSGSGGGSYAGAAAQQAQAAATMAASLPHTFRHYTIWGDGYVYIVSCPASRHMPNVTVNGPIRYATEKDRFYLLDEDNREFRAWVIEKRLTTPPVPR